MSSRKRAQRRAQQQRRRASRAASDIAALADRAEHRLRDALDQLQRHVAGEAVGDDHVGGARVEVGALDVADEAAAPRRRQLCVRLRTSGVPFLTLAMGLVVGMCNGIAVAFLDVPRS